ncbi:MAG TPA: exodeoxyribonuclease I [Candidatus Saccharimonadales bacterium]|nr:exodeoxyribonuclease I [Candidatus Saccharimonadales bacterium]
MASSFFFYDLETSGFNPRSARIMQFAGQRTDANLMPVGEPLNYLIKLTPDVLPEPDAILVTGITPQQTLAEGLTEAEFLKLFYEQAVQPDTTFLGFNSIRFDDEFMRFLLYRNFYDAYEWQWKDGCSRWDLLDVVRMTRALRPDGIEWPYATDGKPTNRLEFLTKVNKLSHESVHDALSDVQATIAVAQLIQKKQPELWHYLATHRDKKTVGALIEGGQPFVYTTGRYSSEFQHTSVAVMLGRRAQQDAALVYDLRFDPTPFLKMSPSELKAAWKYNPDPEAIRLPVKTVKYNRCPTVAPLGVIKDKASQERIGLDLETVGKHLELLKPQAAEFAQKLAKVVAEMDEEQASAQTSLVDNQLTVDERLYDNFLDDADRNTCRAVIAADPGELTKIAGSFHDERLRNLLPLYKARNYPKSLSDEERQAWDKFVATRLFSGGAESRLGLYFKRLEELAAGKLTGQQKYLLEELTLYGQSIAPVDAAG